jgi:hypothetical protein
MLLANTIFDDFVPICLTNIARKMFGEKPKKREPPTLGGTGAGGEAGGNEARDGRSTTSAPDFGARASRIDFLYCQLYAAVHVHRTLTSSSICASAAAGPRCGPGGAN